VCADLTPRRPLPCPLPLHGRGAYLFWMLFPSSRPDATFDLHGLTVLDAVTDAERFLRAQQKGGRRVVRLVTGRGKSGGGAPIRTRIRTLLKRLSGEVVAEFELEDSEGSFLVELRVRS
jgi:DNA-nicking Smr family endonuclease